ncbi:trehalose-6-phosphate synthase [Corynebacterium sp. ES2715-CONJ3]|uniref:alpha,alpha-trehalose-phosphate synthase (UDP-forming) n=1 Tax=Corynebacterium sp. ES2715-CONJ3 TaxID=2974028 RepID=UPI002167E345|nr:trehalose-6-phosphate synthase [Corynebacterium sp. ES2715-CONJ3]MCS4491909.1 trehalose-6-phosphate synthase [Corynebacterium sp. ES2715-CONJ3]
MNSPHAPTGTHDFVVVANRLPVDLTIDNLGASTWSPSPGGLVSALSPILSKHSGCWVGWPGAIAEKLEPFHTDNGILLHPVELTRVDYENFYEGFSNATLWPLYHDLIVSPEYRYDWWQSYHAVNVKFAEEAASVAAPGATVWVQDYQLQLVPGLLRELRPDLTIGLFLHIPFPAPDLFRQLPWRTDILAGMLGADLIGFHLISNAQNFLDIVDRYHPERVSGSVKVRQPNATIHTDDDRVVKVAAFPISIDPEPFVSAHVDRTRVRREMGNPETLILGVDRLDYTKGILQRLEALESLLEEGLIDHRTSFVQIATPSRERIDHYQATRSKVEEAVGRINGRFGALGKPVVSYHHASLSKERLIELYSAADIMLVTPFKDGMNLVAKEYVACHGDGSGALVLSEFAGAATELVDAYLCNPFDSESIKAEIHNAMMALATQPEIPQKRMLTMYQQVITHDVDLWARSYLDALKESSR